VSSSEFFLTVRPPSVSRFAIAFSSASRFRPQARAWAPSSSTTTPRVVRPRSSAPGRASNFSDVCAGTPDGALVGGRGGEAPGGSGALDAVVVALPGSYTRRALSPAPLSRNWTSTTSCGGFEEREYV